MAKEELKKFKYSAVDISGKKTSGIMLAENETSLKKMLLDANLYLISCKTIAEVPFFSMSSKVKISEITSFSREFAIMINAGIDITDALDTLRMQPYSGLFKRVINTVYNDVRSGLLLSEAFGKHKKVFPELFVSMTYIGEMSSSLDSILNELATYYERDYKLRQKTRNSLVYPTMLAILTLCVLIVLVAVIVPTFKDTLNSLDVEIPPLTNAIIKISDFFAGYWQYVLLALVAILLVIILISRIEKVKYIVDAFKAKAPIIRKVTEGLVSSRFARGFGTLIAGGVDVMEALQIMDKTLGNRYYQKKFLAAVHDIEEGHSISEAFNAHKVFPSILIQMISTGEKTGSLADIKRTADYFDSRVEGALSRMATLLEPTIIVFMGVIVAIVMAAVFAPLMSIINNFGV